MLLFLRLGFYCIILIQFKQQLIPLIFKINDFYLVLSCLQLKKSHNRITSQFEKDNVK